MKSGKLTDRQKLFCEYFAANPHGTAAAIQAGYSKKTAAQLASRLLKNRKIREYLNRLQTAQAGERIADATEIQSTFTRILRDAGKPAAARLRAGELLLRAGGQFDPPDEPLPDESENGGVQIALPWTARDPQPITAITMPDHSIIPLSEHEEDPILITINPFSPVEMREFWKANGIMEGNE